MYNDSDAEIERYLYRLTWTAAPAVFGIFSAQLLDSAFGRRSICRRNWLRPFAATATLRTGSRRVQRITGKASLQFQVPLTSKDAYTRLLSEIQAEGGADWGRGPLAYRGSLSGIGRKPALRITRSDHLAASGPRPWKPRAAIRRPGWCWSHEARRAPEERQCRKPQRRRSVGRRSGAGQ